MAPWSRSDPRLAPLGYELADATHLDGRWLLRIALIWNEADDCAAQLHSAGDVRHQPLESGNLIIAEWRAIGAAVDADKGRPGIIGDQVAAERLDQPERVVEFGDEARPMVLVAEDAPGRGRAHPACRARRCVRDT